MPDVDLQACRLRVYGVVAHSARRLRCDPWMLQHTPSKQAGHLCNPVRQDALCNDRQRWLWTGRRPAMGRRWLVMLTNTSVQLSRARKSYKSDLWGSSAHACAPSRSCYMYHLLQLQQATCTATAVGARAGVASEVCWRAGRVSGSHLAVPEDQCSGGEGGSEEGDVPNKVPRVDESPTAAVRAAAVADCADKRDGSQGGVGGQHAPGDRPRDGERDRRGPRRLPTTACLHRETVHGGRCRACACRWRSGGCDATGKAGVRCLC